MRVKTDQLPPVSKSPSGISSSGTEKNGSVPPRHFKQNDQLNIIKQGNMIDSFSQLNPVIRYSETYNLPPDKVSNKCKLDDLNVGIKNISLNIESDIKEENAVSARSPNNILSKNIGNNISASPQIKDCDNIILKSIDGRNFLVKSNLVCSFDDKRSRKNTDENGTSTDAEADDEGDDEDDNVAVDSRDEGKAKSDQSGDDEESTASKFKDKKTSLKTNTNNSAVSELDLKFSNLKLKDGTNNTHQSSIVIVRSKDCKNGVIKSLGRLMIVPSDSDSSSDSGGEDEPIKVGSGLIAKGPMRKPLVNPNQKSGVPFCTSQRRVALENRYSSVQNFVSPASARPSASVDDDLEKTLVFSDYEAAFIRSTFIRSTPKNLAIYLGDGILDQDSRSSNEENVSPRPELYSPQFKSVNIQKNVFKDTIYPPCIDNIQSKPNTEIQTLNIPVTTYHKPRSNSATSVFEDDYTPYDSDYESRTESNEGSPFSCYSPDRVAEGDQACSPSVMNIPTNIQTTLCVPNIRSNTVSTGCKQSVPKTPVKFQDGDSFAVVYGGNDGATETCLNDQQWSSNQVSAVSDCNLPVIQANSSSVYYTSVPVMGGCYVYNQSGQQLSSPNFLLTPAANSSNDTTKNIPSRKVRSIVQVGGVQVFEDEMKQSGYERLKGSCKNDLFVVQYISTLVKMGELGEEKKSLILTDILKELSSLFGDTQPNSNSDEISKLNQVWREKLHAHIECAFQSFDKEKGIFTRPDTEGNTPLKLAAFSNYKEPLIARCIADCIVKQNLRADEIDNSGNTIIHRLCLKGDSHINVLAELLNVKNNGLPVFNVNARNLNNETPLHYAATSNLCSVTVLQLLRHRDAAVDAQDINNATPLHALLSTVYQEYDIQKLKCLLASPSCQRALFVKDCNGNTPLMIAALNNNVSKTNQLKAIQKLVDSNAISTKQRAYEKMKKGILSLVEHDRVEDVRAILEGTKRYN